MTKVVIEPGICGFTTQVEAITTDEDEVTLSVESGCASVVAMMEAVGNVFDSFELCLKKPGTDPLTEFASKNFPVHASCPIIAGILKCAEVESHLALKKNASITFVD